MKALLLLGILIAAPIQDVPPIRGFSAEGSRIERDWEAKFKAIPTPDSLRA